MPQSWFSFKNSADGKSVEIYIYDVIGSYEVSAKSFISELKRAGSKDVLLRIHSPGGNILEGNAIYNALKRHTGSIDVVIDGIAASMASVVAMAGDTIEIAENGLIMIHNPSTYGGGDSRDMRKMADVMDKMKANIITAYEQKTGLSRETLAQMMNDETWMTAAEALENKFVDLIGAKVEAKNSFDLSSFKNSARLTDLVTAMSKPSITELEGKIVELQLSISDSVTASAELAATHGAAIAAKDVTISALEATAAEFVTTTAATRDAHALVLTAKDAEILQLTGSVAKLEGDAKSADDRAKELAAAHGIMAVPSDAAKEAAAQTAATITLENFRLLSPSERMAFCKAGGQITDLTPVTA